ncbi:MAG: PleD family two-component system response regulator [Nitrospinales bacterium]
MKKILIVDDQAPIRELVFETLNGLGDYKIIQTGSGEESIKIARREKPHLIFLDIMMPGGIDGLEVTKILKTDPQTRNCIIILLSAKGQNLDKEKGFESGADDYLVKPFSPLKLIEKVEDLLGH